MRVFRVPTQPWGLQFTTRAIFGFCAHETVYLCSVFRQNRVENAPPFLGPFFNQFKTNMMTIPCDDEKTFRVTEYSLEAPRLCCKRYTSYRPGQMLIELFKIKSSLSHTHRSTPLSNATTNSQNCDLRLLITVRFRTSSFGFVIILVVKTETLYQGKIQN